MAGLDDVVQKVLLEGDGEVTQALKEIGVVGAETFDKLVEAAEKSVGGMGLISIAIAGVATALSIATAAFLEFVESNDEAIDKAEALASAFGTTAEGLEGLKTAFASVGVSGQIFERSVQRMSSTVAREWSSIQDSVRKSANEQQGAMLGIQSAHLATEKAVDSLAESNSRAAQAAVHDGQEQQSVALALEAAQQKLASNPGGGGVSATAKANLQLKQDTLAVEKAQTAVGEQNLASAERQHKETVALKEGVLNIQKARLAEAEAAEKAHDVDLHSIPVITKALDVAKTGGEKAAGGIDLAEVSVQNMVKSIVKLSADTGDEGPKGFAVLHKAAELFSGDVNHMISEGQRLAIVQQLIGAGARQGGASIAQISELLGQGTGALDAYGSSVNKLSEAFPHSASAAKDFIATSAELSNSLQQVKESIASAISPALTAFLKAINEQITDDTSLTHKFVSGLKEIGGGISTVASAFGSAFEFISKTLSPGQITGFKIALAEVAIVAVSFLAPWLVLPAAILLVVTAIGAVKDAIPQIQAKFKELAADQGWIGAIIRGIQDIAKGFGIIIGAVTKFLGLQVQASLSTADKKLANSSLAQDAGSKDIESSARDSVRASQAASGLGTAAEGAKTGVDELGQSAGTAATALQKITGVAPPEGHAEGGPIRGPGDGKSDSIPARLSNGEYVVTANGSNLMDAINHFGANVAGFAEGGFVGGPIAMRSAEGGNKSGGSVLNLRIGDNQFNGLHGPEPVMNKLSQYAVGRQTSSAGRRPSWFK